MGKGRWVTPVSAPSGTVHICLAVPDDPAYWGAIRAFLRELSFCQNWENVGGIAPEDAAAYAAIIWASFEAKEPCS